MIKWLYIKIYIGSSSATYSIISKYLGVDWDQILKFINTRSDIAFAPTM